jgi:uncharacterized protein
MTASGPPIRLLPRLDDLNHFFWTSGEQGVLRFLRCGACDLLVHPPVPRCPYCLTEALEPSAVSGRAVLHSFTVNHQQWFPGAEPYIVGLVSVAEQEDVRLTTNVVGCDVDDLAIGMALQVTFEHHDDVWLPLFAPAVGP